MNKLRKILALILCMCLAIAFVGCGNNASDSVDRQDVSKNQDDIKYEITDKRNNDNDIVNAELSFDLEENNKINIFTDSSLSTFTVYLQGSFNDDKNLWLASMGLVNKILPDSANKIFLGKYDNESIMVYIMADSGEISSVASTVSDRFLEDLNNTNSDIVSEYTEKFSDPILELADLINTQLKEYSNK